MSAILLQSDTFDEQVRVNQEQLTANLQHTYDYIVCGSGSAGSVVARRLAEDSKCRVLLLEAGGGDVDVSVTDPGRWFMNLGTDRVWSFVAEPNAALNGRRMPLEMGRGLGGGSSVNAMIWSRGHKDDWEFFSEEAGDPAWNYASVLDIYRRIENWHGAPDPQRRGSGGLVHVESPMAPNPLAPAVLAAAVEAGLPVFEDQNGIMMEGAGGAALTNLRIRDGKRQSIFRTYLYPLMAQPNLTVVTQALVLRLIIEKAAVTGVEVLWNGKTVRIHARYEVILSLGAIHTPKVLMQTGIGDAGHLQTNGIRCRQHLPGVGQNLQDHLFVAGCIWEYIDPLPPRNNAGEATIFWKSEQGVKTPDLQPNLAEIPLTTTETARYLPPQAAAWTIVPGLVRPKSRGCISLSGHAPDSPVRIFSNALEEPADLQALRTCVDLVREIGNSRALAPFRKRELMPGDLKAGALDRFIQDGVNTYWHQSCTAKMGRDSLSVVDSKLRVHGISGLRVADASIMPRVTTGNTMAPCVIIGELASQFLKQ